MSAKAKVDFDPKIFLSTIGDGRRIVSFRKKQIIFAQGDTTDAVFVIQKGKVRLSAQSIRFLVVFHSPSGTAETGR
jgi:CRP-like cAMP-binding protein